MSEGDEFDGCARQCRRRGKHTLLWGSCEHGVRPAPTLDFFQVITASDGYPAGVYKPLPLAAVLPWAASLTVDQQHEMLEEAAEAEDPAACIEEWRTTAASSPDTEEAILRFTPEEMRDLRRIARERDTTVDELIHEWLHERLRPAQPSLNTPGAMLSINMGAGATDAPPGINMGIVAAAYEHGWRQGRYEAGG